MKKSIVKKYQRSSTKLLKKLVTKRGIYASSDNGWRGAFHAWFGRDSAITAMLIFSADELSLKTQLSKKAYQGLLHLRKWQGTRNNPDIGEEKGKITHEVRIKNSRNKETLARLTTFKHLWFFDKKGQVLKSWDSVDSTPLWIIGIARWHESRQMAYRPDVLDDMRLALQWCLDNLEHYDGLAGFLGTDLSPERKTTGMHNQGWKDNFGTYQYPDGSLAKHPIKDVFVNGLFWAALKYGADIFQHDSAFAAKLETAANTLKRTVNNRTDGFLITDKQTGLDYFAEALDGDGKKLDSITADVAMCLWAYFGDECIIEKKYVGSVVKRIMLPDMLDPEAGMRNYSNSTPTKKLYVGGYHRGSNTYWPFVSGLIVHGLDHFGYKKEAKLVAEGAFKGIRHFDSNIEMFVKTAPHTYASWHHISERQESATDQAWTAAAIYYMTTYIQQPKQ